MFKNNKYTRIYFNIINRAKVQKRIKSKNVYYEKHHIIPKCLNGTDDKENLILLTSREHYLCHWLLCKMHDDRKLLFAFSQFQRKFLPYDRILSSKQYEIAKLYAIKALKTPSSEKFKEKLKKANLGKQLSIDTKVKISMAKKGIKISEETKKKISNTMKKLGITPPVNDGNSFLGKHHTEQTKQILSEKAKIRWNNNKEKYKNSIANRDLSFITDEYRQKKREQSKKLWEDGIISRDLSGKNNPMYGKTQSDETRKKISIKNKGKLAGNKNPMFGKKRTKEVKAALSKFRTGSCWMYNDELKKSIQVQKDKIIEYMIDGWDRGRKKY